jgi:two-component system sensor histidine kinase ChiS
MSQDDWNEPPVILLIDDEPEVLEALRTQLKDRFGAEFEIETSSTGAEAIDLVKGLIEDGVELRLVISDEIMPQMRGHKVLAELHEMVPQAKTILLTGQADTHAVAEAVNHADLFHFISKPWESIDLLLTVKRAAESYEEEQLKIARLRMFHRFVPADFLSVLNVEDPIDTRVGMGTTQDMAVMFTDIRGFSTLSEGKDPDSIFATLNEIFGIIVPAVVDNGGVIDKFVGDGVMALFTIADHAVTAGIRIVQETRVAHTRLGPIEVGVGINWGELFMGTVGTEDRIQTTVVGDVVNVAARLEECTKHMQTPVIISAAIAEQSEAATRFLGRHPVRGRREATRIYELLDLCDDVSRRAVEANSEQFSAIADQIGIEPAVDSCVKLELYVEQNPLDRVAARILFIMKNFGIYAAQGR